MTIDSADDSKISNRTITTNRISNRTYDSKSNRITNLRRSLLNIVVYRSLSGHAPDYLADDCQLVTETPTLAQGYCVPLTRGRWLSTSFGDRTFAAAATRVCNSLPPDLRIADLSYSRGSGGRWRHFYFGQPDNGALWTLLTAPFGNILTYLITYHTCPEKFIRDNVVALFLQLSFVITMWQSVPADKYKNCEAAGSMGDSDVDLSPIPTTLLHRLMHAIL